MLLLKQWQSACSFPQTYLATQGLMPLYCVYPLCGLIRAVTVITWPLKINNIDAIDSLPRNLEHRN